MYDYHKESHNWNKDPEIDTNHLGTESLFLNLVC